MTPRRAEDAAHARSPEARQFLAEFSRRHTAKTIAGRLRSLKRLRALVVGEAIIDEYHYCQAMGKSPKETIVATRYLEEEAFAGGALATANHLAGFVDEVDLVTCLGAEDSREDFIRAHLRPNVRPRFFLREGAPSIIKRRFVDPAFLTKMFEVCYIADGPLPRAVEEPMLAHLADELPRHDLVVVADYGHGLISPRAVKALCARAPFLAVNAQTNSANIGYNVITKVPRADYVCIDEPELRLAARDSHGEIEGHTRSLAKALKTKRFVVTRGHRGALAWSPRESVLIPVFSSRVVDRTGAGDAFLALSSLCAAGGLPMELVGFIGNAAGALHVATVCNRTPIEPQALLGLVEELLTRGK
jgi:sugar/nucleoside kinase (ribokinase family)